MAEKKETKEVKTSMGLKPNIAALLSYLFGIISGLVFFLGEKENKFVRFHALQSIVFTLVIIAVEIVLWLLFSLLFYALPLTLWGFVALISWVIWIGILAVWILLMVKAYQEEEFKLPVIGDFCKKQIK